MTPPFVQPAPPQKSTHAVGLPPRIGRQHAVLNGLFKMHVAVNASGVTRSATWRVREAHLKGSPPEAIGVTMRTAAQNWGRDKAHLHSLLS